MYRCVKNHNNYTVYNLPVLLRFADDVDPPYKPTPLHLITRTRSLKKKPWWEKDIMKCLGLDGKV